MQSSFEDELFHVEVAQRNEVDIWKEEYQGLVSALNNYAEENSFLKSEVERLTGRVAELLKENKLLKNQ